MDAKRSGHKSSRYLELFQFINQQEEYDEKAVKAKFGKKLGDDKARLYEALLASLRDYQSKKSYKTRIKELLTDAKILFQRELFTQAQNRLKEAKQLAVELEDFAAVLEINWEQRQLVRFVEPKDYDSTITSLIAEKEQQIELIKEQFKMQDSLDMLSIDMQKSAQNVGLEARQLLFDKYDHLVGSDESAFDSFFTQRRYHQGRAILYRLAGEMAEEFTEFERTFLLWQAKPKIKEEYYHLYLIDVTNFLTVTLERKEHSHSFPQVMAQLQAEKAVSPQNAKLLFEKTAVLSLFYYINTANDGYEEAAKDIANNLKKYDLKIKTELAIYFNLVLLYFLNDQFATAMEWSRKIITITGKHRATRVDIQYFNQIVRLLAIYRYGAFEEIENTYRSVKRFFDKQAQSATKTFAVLLLNTVRALLSSVDRKEEKQLLLQLKEDIETLERKPAGGMDEISVFWIESDLTSKSIGQLRKQKNTN